MVIRVAGPPPSVLRTSVAIAAMTAAVAPSISQGPFTARAAPAMTGTKAIGCR